MLNDGYEALCHDILVSNSSLNGPSTSDVFCECQKYIEAEQSFKTKLSVDQKDVDYGSALSVFLDRLDPPSRVTVVEKTGAGE